MSRFTYKGITEGGMTVDGVVEAFDEIEAMELARMQCRIVQAVNPVRESKNILAMDVTKPRVKPKVLAMLCAQLSTILGAGLPISRAIALVADQTTNKYLKRVLSEVVSDVSAGFGIADSLANKGDALPTVFIETIRAGEESGHLAEAFTRLHVYYDKRAKVAAKVSAALTYPIFVLIIASIVIMAMMVMVIPAMTGMISSLGGEMPLITQILINMSGWMSQNIVWVLLVMVLLIIGLKLYARTESGKTIFGLIKLKIPVLGVISVYSGAAQCANTLAMLIAAGLSMPRAVHIVSRVT
ncbi:MAG: type II secretion system F family protein, partial [Raoultibacter sp.]